jgi:integrase
MYLEQSSLAESIKRKADFVQYATNFINKKPHDTFRSALIHYLEFQTVPISFEKINKKYAIDFKKYLQKKINPRTNEPLSSRSVAIYYFRIAAAWRNAISENIVTEDVFLLRDKNKMRVTASKKRIFLEIDEVRKLNDLLVNGGLIATDKAILRLFIFACFTGLRYSDCIALKWNDIKTTANSVIISIKIKKTKDFFEIPLHDNAKQIIDDIKGGGTPKKESVIFDFVPSRQDIGRKLKAFAETVGIDKNVHFHAARHTFATMCLSNGITLEQVQKMLGHTDIKSTQIYADMTNDSKIIAINALPKL